MVSQPRMIAIYRARKHTTATYGEISAHFGNRTHRGAVAAEKHVRNWLAQNGRMKIGEREWAVRELVERIERGLERWPNCCNQTTWKIPKNLLLNS